MTLAVHGRETGVPNPFPGLTCPSCQADLYVAGYQEIVLLVCRCGRQVSPGELMGCASAVESLLEVWQDRLDSLVRLSYDAQYNGFPDILDRHIRNLRSRIELLRDAILHQSWPASTSTSEPRGPAAGAAGWPGASAG